MVSMGFTKSFTVSFPHKEFYGHLLKVKSISVSETLKEKEDIHCIFLDIGYCKLFKKF